MQQFCYQGYHRANLLKFIIEQCGEMKKNPLMRFMVNEVETHIPEKV